MTDAAPPRRQQGRAALWVGLGLGAAALGAFVWLLAGAQALPQGVEPPVWDKTACANCRMHVGERGFAAQLQLQDGRVLNFDDPGCLFAWQARTPGAAVHATYFHHHAEERWIPAAQVGFVKVSPTPMGFGLGAVDVGAPGALGLEQARAQVLKPGGAAAPEVAR